MKRLFIDMDGTLAECQEGTPFEIVCENGYAANLPVNGNMVDATKSLVKLCHKKGVEVFILSAVLDLSHSIPDKDKWLDNVLPGVFDTEHRLYVPYGMNKAEFVMQKLDANKNSAFLSQCYLLDDYSKNIREWTEAGGKAIKVFNGVNGRSGTFYGAYTCSWLNARQIVADVLRNMGLRADTWVCDILSDLLEENRDNIENNGGGYDLGYAEGYQEALTDVLRGVGYPATADARE